MTQPALKTVQILPAFPEFGAFTDVLTFNARKWTFEYEWRPRLTSWFVSIYDDELNPVVQGRRVVVGSNLTYGVLGFPGSLPVVGRFDVFQNQLGQACQVLYVELDD